MALNNLINSPFPTIVAKGGTGLATITSHGIMMGNGTGNVTPTAEPANGQLLIGSTGNFPVLATLTDGAGISITEGAGTITIASTVTGFSTVNQTAPTVTMAVNTQYINTSIANAAVTYTIPTTAAQGDIFRIIGVTGNSGGWVIQANTGQTLWVGNVACSTAGTWTSGDKGDVLEFVCTVADTVFVSVGGVTGDLSST